MPSAGGRVGPTTRQIPPRTEKPHVSTGPSQSRPTETVDGPLAELAAGCGVATWYDDGENVRHDVGEATVRAVLAALGVEVGDDPSAALETVRLRPWRRVLPPTVVTRTGWTPRVELRCATGDEPALEVVTEDGDRLTVPVPTEADSTRDVDGVATELRVVALPSGLPAGWHRIVARAGDGSAADAEGAGSDREDPDRGTVSSPGGHEATLLVAPRRVPLPASLERRPAFGLQAQLYQIRSAGSWGVGDLEDLADLADWSARDLGADFVLVNPMHAAEPVPPLEPSPYLPTSRLFASPLYLRVEAIDELVLLSEEDRRRVAELAARGRALDERDTVDRDACWELKLDALRLVFAAGLSGRRAARFDAFVESGGEALRRFAVWSALAAEYGPRWRSWPEGLRRPDGDEVEGYARDHADDVRFQLWLQWLVAEQRADVQHDALDAGMRLGIVHDLAVGVHPEGADAWALTNSLARGVSVGAPPDMYNQRGQDWSQPPLRPDALRRGGYSVLRDLVRSALRDSGGLRIDHILGLFRLWWIPEGSEPTEGTYVSYDSEAMLGVLALEASRTGAVVVGEDLGTVAPGVREALAERGVLGTSVVWFEQDEDGPLAPETYRRLCMASVTTHDLPPTAGYADLVHVDIRSELGQLTGSVEDERRRAAEDVQGFVDLLRSRGALPEGSPTAAEVSVGMHRLLAHVPSVLTVVSVADLVGDRRPVNVPGTSDEYPNWRVPLSGPSGELVTLENLRRSPFARTIAEAARGTE